MPLNRRSALVLALLGSLSIGEARAEGGESKRSPSAAGSESAACAQAYEQAQEQRQSGKLLEARAEIATCARDACPEFIRSDCLAWDGELRAETPTVVFAAQSAGRDLSDVRVSIGPRVLASHIDGEAIELDPGEYDFEFNAKDMQPLTQHVLISRGERNRLLRAELVPLLADGRGGEDVPLPPPHARSFVLPAVLGGVGVLGLAGFGVFAAWGHSAESGLETSCSPRCSKDQIASVRTKYTIADVSLAAGVASLGIAAYLALSASPEHRTAKRSPFDVHASARSVSLSYQGAF